MAKDEAYYEAEKKIEEARESGATELDLSEMGLVELPETISRLTGLTALNISLNQITELPEWLSELSKLRYFEAYANQLSALPKWFGNFTQLTWLSIGSNKFQELPKAISHLENLTYLSFWSNQITELPDWLVNLKHLKKLYFAHNKLRELPKYLLHLEYLQELEFEENELMFLPEWLLQMNELIHLGVGCKSSLPEWLGGFKNLQSLKIKNELTTLPAWLLNLSKLSTLIISFNKIIFIPDWISELTQLKSLSLHNNQLNDLPPSLAHLEHLTELTLDGNPLNPALQSAYDQGLDAVKAYLRSLEQNAEPLYEAKLVLVGEGNVGKTTLLKALKGKKGEEAPKKDETKTHGVEIDIYGLRLLHPEKDDIEIHLNAWDFGGQEIYRVTHQFFFSRRSLYLLVWEPRRNVQQAQVEDWLNMIRLRVGDEARVLIVSTHCKSGETLARIDKPVLQQQYGDMIVGFYEVDSLVPEESTGEMVGIAELKRVIAEESAKLQHMGMPFNLDWKAARDELVARPEPHISYGTFAETCARHGLSDIDTTTLAGIMNDLGYIVHYSDDEKLRDDVVLKPEWLTKAIGFVLEDPETAKHEGILLDSHLFKVWHDHTFKSEPRYDPTLYPFFLRLMEKYDVSYRLPEGDASLVAQHVPQVRPSLPWLPEEEPKENQRRIAMVCSMEEDPPGLVPWMIVRTHDYAAERNHHRLHWQKGMFLSHPPHGEAMLEKRGREFHVYTQADWPEYFMNVLQNTLQKLIDDNWPGLKDRYRFMVPCPEVIDGQPCKGRFNINALRQFLAEGDATVRCQECSKKQPIVELLFGFEERTVDVQLREIKEQLAGMDSRIANYFMATMHAIADESKNGPRLFTFRTRETGISLKPLLSRPLELQLWCEAEGCQHPVIESGKGIYPIDIQHEWVKQVAPYANFALKVLATVAPIADPAINTFFGSKITEKWGIADQLSLASAIIGKLPAKIETSGHDMHPGQMLSEPERSGILALHRFLNEEDPTQNRLGLHRVATYTGDYRWLCKWHYDAWQPNIPDVIQPHD